MRSRVELLDARLKAVERKTKTSEDPSPRSALTSAASVLHDLLEEKDHSSVDNTSMDHDLSMGGYAEEDSAYPHDHLRRRSSDHQIPRPSRSMNQSFSHILSDRSRRGTSARGPPAPTTRSMTKISSQTASMNSIKRAIAGKPGFSNAVTRDQFLALVSLVESKVSLSELSSKISKMLDQRLLVHPPTIVQRGGGQRSSGRVRKNVDIEAHGGRGRTFCPNRTEIFIKRFCRLCSCV